MTLRELYNMVTATSLPMDIEVEVVNGELRPVGLKVSLPPAPSDENNLVTPARKLFKK